MEDKNQLTVKNKDNKWYSIKGRISRLQFAGATLVCLIALTICELSLFFIFMLFLVSAGTAFFIFYDIIAVIVGILIFGTPFFIYGRVIYPIRRLHDLNQSGWLCLLSLIPTVGYLFLLCLALIQGDDFENQYGKPPQPNRKSHYVVLYTTLFMIILIFIVFINFDSLLHFLN